MRRRVGIVTFILVAGAVALAAVMVGRVTAQDWRTASQEPVGLAPDPSTHGEAIVQVYAARVIGWRGVVGVHTWIAVKPAAANAYTVYEIIGWRLRSQDTALVVRHRAPDMRWFGSAPDLVAEKRGAGVEELIARIDSAARSYPWAGEYTMWPGPNSNTFTAWVLRAVPELEADLPPTAIGKDYSGRKLAGPAPSGRGLRGEPAGTQLRDQSFRSLAQATARRACRPGPRFRVEGRRRRCAQARALARSSPFNPRHPRPLQLRA